MTTTTSLLKNTGGFVSIILFFLISFNVNAQIPDACKPIQAEIEALQSQLKFTTKMVRVYDPETRRYYFEEREVPDPGNAAIQLQITAKQAELKKCIDANPCFAKPFVEGSVYKECSSPDRYVLNSNKMIFIPTADALEAMGYTVSMIKIVPDGALSTFQKFTLPSASPTPGSLVFPPNRTSHFPLWTVNATKVISQGKEIQISELRGWIVHGYGPNCGDGNDSHIIFEVDTDWALEQGINLQNVLRVGNILMGTFEEFSPRRMVSVPVIVGEINSNGKLLPAYSKFTRTPADWTFTGVEGCADKIWPFSLVQPLASKPALANGQYIRIVGSLVTDSPHDLQSRPSVWLSRYWGLTLNDAAEWEGSVPDWHPGIATDSPLHFARWTEVHPPDLIEVLPNKAKTTTLRAVALCARTGVLLGGMACEEVDFDIYPETPRPANSELAFAELRGPECFFPVGQNANNGSWIVRYDDHIRIKAKVCGGGLGGPPGRFKAFYRVWWAVKPPEQLTRFGSFTTTLDGNTITYMIEPGVVNPATVEFNLCLGPGLTWQKRMNLPDGIGSSWNITVQDNIRCAHESLWAAQVNNGQKLTFFKAKAFGILTQVHTLPLSGLGPIPPGSRVTFTWINDQ